MNCNFRNNNKVLQDRVRLVWIALITWSICTVFFQNVYPRITISITPSVQYRIFWTKPKDKFHKGQYVKIITDKIKSDLCRGKCPVVKRIGCLSGEYLSEEDRDYLCNGEKISKGLPDKKLFKFNGIIPKGKIFLIGDHERSYDSKAVGFFDVSEIKSVLVPLF